MVRLGVTPKMLELGVLCRDLNNLAAEASRIEDGLHRVMYEMAPDALPEEDFWLSFHALVDLAAQAREEARDG
jgi:hypothetical protein